jgi:hypothetical protein
MAMKRLKTFAGFQIPNAESAVVRYGYRLLAVWGESD